MGWPNYTHLLNRWVWVCNTWVVWTGYWVWTIFATFLFLFIIIIIIIIISSFYCATISAFKTNDSSLSPSSFFLSSHLYISVFFLFQFFSYFFSFFSLNHSCVRDWGRWGELRAPAFLLSKLHFLQFFCYLLLGCFVFGIILVILLQITKLLLYIYLLIYFCDLSC